MSDLQTGPFGSTGQLVSKLGFGGMELGRRRDDRKKSMDPGEATKMLNAALDAGITFVDTSPDYGKSEELIGQAISHRRDEFFLASKCGCLVGDADTGDHSDNHIFTRDNIRAAVEQSLRRLRTDHLDLVQIHMSPSRDELEREDSVAELQALRDAGKLRFIGISATLPNIADHLAMGVFDAFQIPYSVVEPEHDAWITAARQAGAGTVIRGGVSRGATARMDVDLGRLSKQSLKFVTARRSLWDQARLDELLDGMNRAQFTLRFTLSHPDLNTTIVGTATPHHMTENIETARKGPLPDDVYLEAKRRVAEAVAAPA